MRPNEFTPHLHPVYMEVVYINLDRDTERRKGIERELEREEIKARRFAGIDARQIKHKELDKLIRQRLLTPDRRWLMTKGHRHWGRLGVHLSHFYVWRESLGSLDKGRESLEEQEGSLLVLEDDIVLPYNFLALVEEAVRVAPEDWEILFLSSADRIVGTKISEHYVEPFPGHAPLMNHGLFTYLVRKSALPKLIKLTMPISFKLMHLDHIIREHYGRLRAYYLINRLTRHRGELPSSREKGNTSKRRV